MKARKLARHLVRQVTEPHRLRAYFFYLSHPRHPLFTPAATKFLQGYLKPGLQLFEWGAGRSTPFFARYGVTLTSIEHDPKWYQIIQRKMAARRLRVDLKLVEAGPSARSAGSAEFLERVEFLNYVQAILRYPDNFFDLVVVDGRERAACLLIALPKVKPSGLLILDDSQRERYRPAMQKVEQLGWEAISFSYGFNCTTAWRKLIA